MRYKLLVVAAAIVGIGVGGMTVFERWPRASDFEILGNPSLEPQIMSAGKDSPLTAPAVPAPPVATTATPRVVTRARPQLHPDDPAYDKLLAGNYADRRKAFAMAKQCVVEEQTQVRSIAQPCALSPGKWQDLETRRSLIRECAEAGDCWTDALLAGAEGFYGAFQPEEHEALLVRAREAALAKSDPFALASEATRLQLQAQKDGQTPEAKALLARAWSYEVASAEGIALLNGQPFDPNSDINLKAQMAHYSSLSRAEVQAATTEGRKLAQVFKKAHAS